MSPTLPVAIPLRAQLQAANGTCWEATFDGAAVKSNSTTKLQATGQ